MGIEMDDVLEVLVGSTVQELLLSQDATEMTFVTDKGDFSFYCDADCCSESWINHINFVDALLGGTVITTDAVDMHSALGVEPEATRQEVDQVLLHRVTTDKGVCVIEFRNSSNGYYGGWLTEGKGRVSGKSITEDF